MTLTTDLDITLLAGSMVNGYVPANEAFVRLAHAAGGGRLVTATATNTPPGSPAAGDGYLIGASPTGAWAGHANEIAFYFNGWIFHSPLSGERFFAVDTLEQLGYHATYGLHPIQDRWSATEHWTGRFSGGVASANRVYSKTLTRDPIPSPFTGIISTAHGITDLDLTNEITVQGWIGLKTGASKVGFPIQYSTPLEANQYMAVHFTNTQYVLHINGPSLSNHKATIRLTYRKNT